MFGTCSTEGCDKPKAMLGNGCRFHGLIEDARNLGCEDFDRLRVALATTAPITRDERNRRLAASALWSIEWQARDLKRSKKNARAAGATESQIADAVKRGKSAVK